jgi:hypothetical protein
MNGANGVHKHEAFYMYKQYKVEIYLNSLIMHNGQLADPLNDYSRKLKAISGKRAKTDADHEKMADIEYEGGLYLNKKGEVILPGVVLESALVEGARKSKEGKLALAGSFADNDPVISYAGGPLTVQELIKSEDHRLRVAVKVGQAKVMRTRPFFEDVKFEMLISVNAEVANEDQVRRWVDAMLTVVGIGDWRPRHGRGYIESWAAVEVPKIKVA